MIDILGLHFDNEQDNIQSVPGSHLWHDIRGTVEVDGQQWRARMFLYAAPAWKNPKCNYDAHHYFEAERRPHDALPGWNQLESTFESPGGNLKIDSIEPCAEGCYS